MPAAGLEPARHCWQWILSPPRLPIPTHRLFSPEQQILYHRGEGNASVFCIFLKFRFIPGAVPIDRLIRAVRRIFCCVIYRHIGSSVLRLRKELLVGDFIGAAENGVGGHLIHHKAIGAL